MSLFPAPNRVWDSPTLSNYVIIFTKDTPIAFSHFRILLCLPTLHNFIVFVAVRFNFGMLSLALVFLLSNVDARS
jgi:hypothetical protein